MVSRVPVVMVVLAPPRARAASPCTTRSPSGAANAAGAPGRLPRKAPSTHQVVARRARPLCPRPDLIRWLRMRGYSLVEDRGEHVRPRVAGVGLLGAVKHVSDVDSDDQVAHDLQLEAGA